MNTLLTKMINTNGGNSKLMPLTSATFKMRRDGQNKLDEKITIFATSGLDNCLDSFLWLMAFSRGYFIRQTVLTDPSTDTDIKYLKEPNVDERDMIFKLELSSSRSAISVKVEQHYENENLVTKISLLTLEKIVEEMLGDRASFYPIDQVSEDKQ